MSWEGSYGIETQHREWMWATDNQVRRRIDQNDKTMEFVREAEWRIGLEGFQLKAEINVASTQMT